MRHPFRRVHLYTLAVGFVSFAVLYAVRTQLTTHFVNVINPSPLWFWMENWQHTEFVTALIGLLTGFNMYFFSRMHGWRHKSRETPQQLVDISPKLDTLNSNIQSLNENIYSTFKYFNPVLEEHQLRFDLTQEGLISLREAKTKIDTKNKIVQHHKDKIEQLEEAEIDT